MELSLLRDSEHGVLFMTTVNQILNSIRNSVLKGEFTDSHELSQVMEILSLYASFDIPMAHRRYGEICVDLRCFIAKMRWDPSYTTSQVRSWGQIERILAYLVGDGQRFIDIANEPKVP